MIYFFGWFGWNIIENRKIKYANKRDSDNIWYEISARGIRLIFGYFQIGKMIKDGYTPEPWMKQNRISTPSFR